MSQIRRIAVVAVSAGLAACAHMPHTRVLVAYPSGAPLDHVALQVVNATGSPLPMPPPGLVEQAVRVITHNPDHDSDIVDAFAQAGAAQLATIEVRSDPTDAAALRRLRIMLTSWDVRDNGGSGAVVFVSTDYQLLDEHDAVLWEVAQENLPVRLSGPNLSRFEVARVANTCTDAALESLAAARKGSGG